MDTFPYTTPPNWGMQDSVAAEVDEQSLGDGYVLVRPKGINYLRESWNPTWDDVPANEATDIYTWLKARLKVTPFLWEHPVTEEAVQVRCQSVSLTYGSYGVYSVTAQLEQDFTLGS